MKLKLLLSVVFSFFLLGVVSSTPSFTFAQDCNTDVQVTKITGCRPIHLGGGQGYCAQDTIREMEICNNQVNCTASYFIGNCSAYPNCVFNANTNANVTACGVSNPNPSGSPAPTQGPSSCVNQVFQYDCRNGTSPSVCNSGGWDGEGDGCNPGCGSGAFCCKKRQCADVPPTPQTITPSGVLACPSTNPTPVTFKWTTVKFATSYYLRIDDLSNGWVPCESAPSNPGDYCIPNLGLNTTPASTATISYVKNLPVNRNYQWWVSAFNSWGGNVQSALSPKVDFVIPAICGSGDTASCQNISAFTSAWAPMTMTQLTQLRPGNTLYYCANGAASTGFFEKVRFKVNGVLSPESSLVRPGTANPRDFCALFTVPSGVTNFNVVAELYHVTLGWVQ